MPFRVCRIVVSGRQPHAQESSVSKNAATKLMQPQISGRCLHADRAGNSAGRCVLSLLDFVHQENVFSEYNGGPALRSCTSHLHCDRKETDQRNHCQRRQAQNAPGHEFVRFYISKVEGKRESCESRSQKAVWRFHPRLPEGRQEKQSSVPYNTNRRHWNSQDSRIL